ncbi:MAG: DegT/DnrJ/EryC1/StrS family aminotransferase [Thermodesulfobacteriota bacterium]
MAAGLIKVAHPTVDKEEVEAVSQVLLSGSYVSGKKVEDFERAFSEYVGCNYSVAVSSGTAALFIALEAIGVGAGDEVIVPPLSFFATVSSVLYVRAVPVFADIDTDDLCLSPSDTAKRVTPRTKAVIAVHLFGNAAKMDALCAVSQEAGIAVIEDCAQAHGTEYKGKRVGGFGKAGCFSFFATKHMTTGEGGMITTNDFAVAEKARILRNHGMVGRDRHVFVGFNNRMTEMEAAMGLVQLGKLDRLNEKRIANSEYLMRVLRDLSWAKVPKTDGRVKHTYFWCPVMVEESSGRSLDELKEHLRRNKIEFRYRYEEPLYKQEALAKAGLDYSDLYLPNAEAVAGKILGLPNHPGLTTADLDRIVEVLRSF